MSDTLARSGIVLAIVDIRPRGVDELCQAFQCYQRETAVDTRGGAEMFNRWGDFLGIS
jgi:hypothetical protein